MKRKIIDDENNESMEDLENKKNKKEYESVVAFECNAENYCYPCGDSTIRSITLLVSTKGIKTSYQFSTFETNLTEKDVLEKSLEVLQNLNSFRLIGYGISLFDLNLIKLKCDKYNLNYKNLFVDNTIDLYAEIPKHIKLQRYRLQDVTKTILGKELKISKNENDLDKNATKHCELYMELLENLDKLII